MKIIGHRGVAGHHPENTKVSIEAAAKLGLEWVEVDVQPTKDNILVICHDHTIDRCSNGSGRIDEQTLAELRQFDFGAKFGSCSTGILNKRDHPDRFRHLHCLGGTWTFSWISLAACCSFYRGSTQLFTGITREPPRGQADPCA